MISLISLDRGLDIYQQYDMNNAFSLSNRLQQYRGCKGLVQDGVVRQLPVDSEGKHRLELV